MRSRLIIGSLALLFIGIQLAPAANYGSIIGWYQGVPAYSNGEYTGKGRGEWQCVEYVKRFYRKVLRFDTSRWWGHANSYYDPRRNFARGLVTIPNGSTIPPKPGDILAFEGGKYGHVAIIMEVPRVKAPYVCSWIKIIQQNWSRDRAIAYIAMYTKRDRFGRIIYVLGNQGSYRVRAWARPGMCYPAPRGVTKRSKVTVWGKLRGY